MTKPVEPVPIEPVPSVWVFGKAEPGWYCARWMPDREYASHLESLGYEVRVQVEKPKV